MWDQSKLGLVVLLESEAEGVVLLELCDFFETLAFDELSHGAAVGRGCGEGVFVG